jgi:hypothetical protein
MVLGPNNPHHVRAPDYVQEHFRATRQTLVNNFGITHEQAAQRLTTIWGAQNAIDREEWDAQQEDIAEVARLEQEQRQQLEEERQRAREEEQELAQQEEQKKNRNKFLPYNKVPIANAIPKLPSPLAIHKLKKGDYVEMYYFTNKGLAEAEASSRSADDKAFSLMRAENGHHSFISVATAKAKDTIIPDKDLTWVEVDEAAPVCSKPCARTGGTASASNPTYSFGWPWAPTNTAMTRMSSANMHSSSTRTWPDAGGIIS